jgi:hypothetical protein
MRLIITIGLSFIFLFSCQSVPERKLGDMKNAVHNAELNYETASETEWKKIESNFDELNADYENDQDSYSEAQKDSVNIQIGRFRAVQTKRIAIGLQQDLENLGKQAEGFIDELSK